MKHRLTFANTIVQVREGYLYNITMSENCFISKDAEKMEADCSFDELTDFCTKKLGGGGGVFTCQTP